MMFLYIGKMQSALNIPKQPRILVIGDILLDHTVHGAVTKLANEAPVPVFASRSETWTLGGAGNVAANLAAFGCDAVCLAGRIGDDADDHAHTLLRLCASYKIQPLLVRAGTTAVKNRYYCEKTLLFRHDKETIHCLTPSEEDTLLSQVFAACETERIDTIVFSDYNKGVLTPRVCREIIGYANARGVFTCVDPKHDPYKYSGCSLIKPNRHEVANLFGVQIHGTDTRAAHEAIHKAIGCSASVITLSQDGMTYWDSSSAPPVHCANRPMDVIDVTGAGDIVCAALAYVYPRVANASTVLKIANHLAMQSVGHLGSYVVSLRDILECRTHVSIDNKCISADALASLLRSLPDTTKSVFTNGCFDIVHVGHLTLLNQCREMGDLVIVGLNSDASIRHLKGPSRPIQTVEARVAFLSALPTVDYICVFDESTPERLLECLKPTILVKGGDYTLDQIVGRAHVSEVRIVPTVAGYSTTGLVGSCKK
jgi:D-beta-D-heptose 7-phosphate kinase/D-beta-D-heptose 1-phosphate adenosyltransferase